MRLRLEFFLAMTLFGAASCQGSNAVFVDHLAIVNINPSHGAVGIGYNTDATVTFSEVLKVQSVTSSSLCITADDTPIADPANPCASALPATVSYATDTLAARVVPAAQLLPDKRYTLHITTGVVGDVSGTLPAIVEASFRTIPTM